MDRTDIIARYKKSRRWQSIGIAVGGVAAGLFLITGAVRDSGAGEILGGIVVAGMVFGLPFLCDLNNKRLNALADDEMRRADEFSQL